jgi:hypothetical protein
MFNTREHVVQSRTQPLIVTLKLDDPAFRRLDELRRRYSHRTATLFRPTSPSQLPGEQESLITADLRQACSARAPFDLEVSGLRFLGRGVAIDAHAAELRELRSTLATAWNGWLTKSGSAVLSSPRHDL